jgi:hypothetical protein
VSRGADDFGNSDKAADEDDEKGGRSPCSALFTVSVHWTAVATFKAIGCHNSTDIAVVRSVILS